MVRLKNYTREGQRMLRLRHETFAEMAGMLDAIAIPAPAHPPRVTSPATPNSNPEAMAARSASYSKPQTTDEWKTRAHELEQEANELHNDAVERENKITELEAALKESQNELQKKTANLDRHFDTLQAAESQAGDAIAEAKLEAQQAREDMARLKESHAIAIKDEQEKTEKARSLAASAFSDVGVSEAKLAKLAKERDEAVALNLAHDDILKRSQEKFAELKITNASEFLEIILEEVAPVLREQDLDVTPQNILSQFLWSRKDEKLKRTASGVSLDQQSLHSRTDSHHRGRKASLHHELNDMTDDEDDIGYLFDDDGKDHWAKPFEQSSPLKPKSKTELRTEQKELRMEYKKLQEEMEELRAKNLKEVTNLKEVITEYGKHMGPIARENKVLKQKLALNETASRGTQTMESTSATTAAPSQHNKGIQTKKSTSATTKGTQAKESTFATAAAPSQHNKGTQTKESTSATTKGTQTTESTSATTDAPSQHNKGTQTEESTLATTMGTQTTESTFATAEAPSQHHKGTQTKESTSATTKGTQTMESTSATTDATSQHNKGSQTKESTSDTTDAPSQHNKSTQTKESTSATTDAPSQHNKSTQTKESTSATTDAPSQHNKSTQTTESPSATTDALRREISLLKAQLDAKPPITCTVITESHSRKATVWENLTQLPWWMKTLFALMLSLYACMFFAAYNERRKWLGANDLSWEITPYDLGRGYSYGTGYSYDHYGRGYSSNRLIRWLADDIFKITRLPYD